MRKIKKKSSKKYNCNPIISSNSRKSTYSEMWEDFDKELISLIKNDNVVFLAKTAKIKITHFSEYNKILWGKLNRNEFNEYEFKFNPLYQADEYLNFNLGDLPLDEFLVEQWLNREFDSGLENFTYALNFYVSYITAINTEEHIIIINQIDLDDLVKNGKFGPI